MCLIREEQILGHSKRRATNYRNDRFFFVSKVPTKITKETMKSAFNEYFADFVSGKYVASEYAVEVIKKVKEQIEEKGWKKFNYRTDKNVIQGKTYQAEIFIDEKRIDFRIKINNDFSQILIKEEAFDPGNSKKLQQLKKFWQEIMNA